MKSVTLNAALGGKKGINHLQNHPYNALRKH